ncbi:FAD-dependent oxidoreductase [Patulibacter minatonensis]|uniref:FAD-dependent oxidoreductase n=1 Tax=Patulibacter minatonensis TaxID=298163 RepID=UPI0004B579C3|nr:FAD-dependent oxidoreductase [Patulibacter minatonensis]
MAADPHARPAADRAPQDATDPPPGSCDLLVVGAGIVGLAVAREALRRRPGLRVAVLEREDHVAAHQTGHNSGVAHSGLYYRPGSLKARLAVQGVTDLYAFCAEHGIAHERCGKVVVASRPDERPRLDELERRGRANGVPGLVRLDAAGIREHEPHVSGVDGLWSPNTGIVDFVGVTRALADEVRALGGTLHLGRSVVGLARRDGHVLVDHAPGAGRTTSTAVPGGASVASGRADGSERASSAADRTVARRAIVCAGAWADALAPHPREVRDEDVRVVPFRGAYRVLRPEAAGLVRGLVYPVPDPDLPFLGVHLTRGVDGEVHAGPTALLVGARDAYRLGRVRRADLGATVRWPGTWRMARTWWRTAGGEVHRTVSRRAMAAELRRMVPELRAEDLLPGPAGVRAQALRRDGGLHDDFVLDHDAATLHVRNAPSPAATASLALAGEIADRAEAAFGLEPAQG